MAIRIRTLGTLEVSRDGEELNELLSQRLRCALLLCLAMDGPITRDELLPLLWPDRSEDRARHSLSQALYGLRQELGSDWLRARGDHLSVSEEVVVDVLSVRDAMDRGAFDEALDLYRGPFLAGVHLVGGNEFENWMDRWRDRLRRWHRQARKEAVGAHRAAGRREAALSQAREWVEEEPLDDEAQHILIELLGEAGHRSEALRQYERYTELLASELDVEPLEQTRALLARIREGAGGEAGGDRVAGTPPSEPPAAVPMGQWTEEQLARELSPQLEIVRPLGRGAMASVFLAREPALGRLVAVKVLRPELSEDTTSRLRFEREARSAARISHPNVVTIYYAGALSSGAPYIVMEYIHGRTLSEHAAATGGLDADEVRRIVAEVAAGLAAAHERHVVHRDVRPANVLIEAPTGKALLSDFGVAAILTTGEDTGPRLTRSGEIVGNPMYVSPEQFAGARGTEQADIYSLGMLWYEILVGEGRANPLAVAQLRGANKRITDVRSDVDHATDALVERCLSARPELRPTAQDVSNELKKEPTPRASIPTARPEPPPYGGFLGALLERRVFQTIGAYLAGSWLTIEAMDLLTEAPILDVPWFPLVLVTLLVGLPVVTVIAWFHGKKGPQSVPRLEVWILGSLALVWLVAVLVLLSGS
jgi:serine/threonine protein kinase/DNA-binding SARP family transcriptional activator